MGLQVEIVKASTSREIQTAFERLARERPDALFVSADPLFTGRRVQLATLAARHAIPAILWGARQCRGRRLDELRHATSDDAFRQVGVYTGRILKGEKPADLPVVQSTKFELVINLQTAKSLGLTCRRCCSPAPTR